MATHQKKHTRTRGPRDLVFKEGNNEEYAKITEKYGECRFGCELLNGEIVIAKLRTAIKKKGRVEKEDLVLLQKDNSTTTKDKYYIINKYTLDEKKKLMKTGELAITRTCETVGTIIRMDNEVAEKYETEIEIDDSFIDDI
jgi:initiation factor 1A